MAILYRVDGSVEEIKQPTLSQLQEAVGGHLETVHLGPGLWMVVDEDGLRKNYPPNLQATQFVGFEHNIVGDFLIASTTELNGEK